VDRWVLVDGEDFSIAADAAPSSAGADTALRKKAAQKTTRMFLTIADYLLELEMHLVNYLQDLSGYGCDQSHIVGIAGRPAAD
jgi:hypothetical protein